MNWLIFLSVAMISLTLVCCQRGTFGRGARQKESVGQAGFAGGAEEAVASKNSLQAGEKALDAKEIKLARKAAKQARLDAKAEKKARRQARRRKTKANRVEAESGVKFETVRDEAAFNSLDAAAMKDSANKLGVSFLNENSDYENARVSSSDGKQFSSGTRLAANEHIGASLVDEYDSDYADEYQNGEAISADEAIADALNAGESFKILGESHLNAQDFSQLNANIFEGSALGGQQGFSQDGGFQNNGFGFGFRKR